jgi:protein TonB
MAAGVFAVGLHTAVIAWAGIAIRGETPEMEVRLPVAAMEVTLMAPPEPVASAPPPPPAPEPEVAEPTPDAVPEALPPPPPAVADDPVVPPPPKKKPRKIVKATRPTVAPRDAEAPVAPTPVAAVGPVSSPVPSAAPVAEAPLIPPDVKAAYLGNPRPPYPLVARRRGMEGVVLLRVLVAPDGHVASIDVARGSGFPVLDRSALDAVRDWRFRPASQGGKAVEALVEVPIRFSLSDG